MGDGKPWEERGKELGMSLQILNDSILQVQEWSIPVHHTEEQGDGAGHQLVQAENLWRSYSAKGEKTQMETSNLYRYIHNKRLNKENVQKMGTKRVN